MPVLAITHDPRYRGPQGWRWLDNPLSTRSTTSPTNTIIVLTSGTPCARWNGIGNEPLRAICAIKRGTTPCHLARNATPLVDAAFIFVH